MSKNTTKAGLHRFEGRDVIGTKVSITNAGDGLSAALAIDPQELSLGQEVYVVLQTTCSKIAYERVKDTDAVTRVQTLKAGTATIVDKELVGDVIEAQKLRIEEADGVVRLDFGGEGEHADE